FGVAPGAYTGADRKGRVGRFKLADGGTLLLDEIGDMPPALQAKLLRALQEGEIEPLGSNRLVPFDARIIAATSRDLPALVQAGQFREDLYYRLNVLPIQVPPLRARRADIPALIEVLGEDMLHRGNPPPELTPDAIALLAAQHWRGNIRELRNVLEQAALRADTGPLDAEPMAALLRQSGLSLVQPALPPEPPPQDAAALLRPLGQQVVELERRAIAAALQATDGNKLAAARLLGISRATLYGRLYESIEAPRKP
ncbi:MAG TPA: sigma 54-interacting transcriptional regulator, partial [Ottowia sp.]|nr:sigma 54-interacting transcriptional regulator [Ottowia sp.]